MVYDKRGGQCAIFDRINVEGFVLCYTMKGIDDVHQTVYKPEDSTCMKALLAWIIFIFI